MFDMSVNILYALILALTLGIILYNISSIKITKKHISIFITITFVVSYYLIFWYKRDNLLVPIETIIMSIYFSLIFRKILYAVLISIITQIIFALSDALTGFILIFILRFNYSEIANNRMLYFSIAVIILIMSFFISKTMNTFFNKLNYNYFTKRNSKDILIVTLSIPTILFSMYSLLITFKYQSSFPNNKILIINIFLIIIFVVLLVIITNSYDKKAKKKLEQIYKENEITQLKEYTYMLETTSNDLRKFKHDYINILQILGGYIESENTKELKDFYKNELMPVSEKILAKDMCFTLLQHIKINSLKGLISSKIITAQSKDIKIHIEISEDIDQLSIGLIDICRIIGVIFDNAIEAAILCESGFIEFLIIKNDTINTFILNNSCIDSTPPVYKIYEKNFSTKGSRRGIGLKSVREIIDLNYTNVFLNTSIDNSIFKQELTIKN